MFATDSLIIIATAGLCALTLLSLVWAWSWKGWLDFKRQTLSTCIAGGPADEAPTHNVGNRIEMADLRERVRKLEAIAAGVEM